MLGRLVALLTHGTDDVRTIEEIICSPSALLFRLSVR